MFLEEFPLYISVVRERCEKEYISYEHVISYKKKVGSLSVEEIL